MLKKILGILLAGCVLLGAAGCSSSEAKDVDLEALGSSVMEKISFTSQLTELTENVIGSFYAFDSADVDDYVVYVNGTGATAEEVALFKASSAEAADRIYELAESRIEDLKFQFENYVPAEMTKLNDPVLIKDGNYVFLGLSNDNEQMKQLFNDALK